MARTLHFFGSNTHAQAKYEQILGMDQSEVSEDILTRTRFNLCQILKGSGISLGMAIRGLNVQDEDENATVFGGASDTKRGKSHAVWRAHQIMMQNVIA